MAKEIEIEKALGVIDKVVPQEVVVEKKEVVVPSHGDDVDNDYAYQRQNFYNLVERGQDAIDGILELAKESEHPRAYEVVSQMIKSVTEANKDLIDLHKQMGDIEGESSSQKAALPFGHITPFSGPCLQPTLLRPSMSFLPVWHILFKALRALPCLCPAWRVHKP